MSNDAVTYLTQQLRVQQEINHTVMLALQSLNLRLKNLEEKAGVNYVSPTLIQKGLDKQTDL